MTKNHKRLNSLCIQCGDYASKKCVNCPVEINRQQEVLDVMRMMQSVTNPNPTGTQAGAERFTLVVSA
jgi:hypothetical protein